MMNEVLERPQGPANTIKPHTAARTRVQCELAIPEIACRLFSQNALSVSRALSIKDHVIGIFLGCCFLWEARLPGQKLSKYEIRKRVFSNLTELQVPDGVPPSPDWARL